MALTTAQMTQFDTAIAEMQEATRLLQEARVYHQSEAANIAAKKAELQAQVDTWITAARSEYPIFRLTKNQRLTNSGGLPDGWSAHPNCVFENVCNITTNQNPTERHAEARLLLSAMGINPVSMALSFNIIRLSWPAGTSYLMYQFTALSVCQTVAAWTKLESGGFLTGAGLFTEGSTSTWGLTGSVVYGSTADRYANWHPVPTAQAGSMLIALPAVVAGRVDLTKKLWGIYPYIGDDKHV